MFNHLMIGCALKKQWSKVFDASLRCVLFVFLYAEEFLRDYRQFLKQIAEEGFQSCKEATVHFDRFDLRCRKLRVALHQFYLHGEVLCRL